MSCGFRIVFVSFKNHDISYVSSSCCSCLVVLRRSFLSLRLPLQLAELSWSRVRCLRRPNSTKLVPIFRDFIFHLCGRQDQLHREHLSMRRAALVHQLVLVFQFMVSSQFSNSAHCRSFLFHISSIVINVLRQILATSILTAPWLGVDWRLNYLLFFFFYKLQNGLFYVFTNFYQIINIYFLLENFWNSPINFHCYSVISMLSNTKITHWKFVDPIYLNVAEKGRSRLSIHYSSLWTREYSAMASLI